MNENLMPFKHEDTPGMPLLINWHEGMLLSQHHMQQNDMRIFQTISVLHKFIAPFSYGILYLEYDKTLLLKGLFQITYLEAIFPDGLVVVFDSIKEPDLRPLGIDLSGQESENITVYISIKKSTIDSSLVIGENPRYYSISGKSVKDNNLEENSVVIPRLVPNMFLTLDPKFPEGCTGFPLCKMKYQDNAYTEDKWTPPCCLIPEDSYLWKTIQTLTLEIREKISMLIEKYKSTSIGTVALDTQRMMNQLKMSLAPLEALIYSHKLKPFDLYIELARVLSLVSILSPCELVPPIKPYDHNDIDGSIYPIINLIEKFLDIITREYTVLPFTKKEYFFYRYLTNRDFDQFDDKMYIGIKGDKAAAVSDVENWMKGAIIVSDFALDAVRTKRIQGASRKILDQEMVARILPSLGVTAFEIELDQRFIKPEQNLHIFNPGRHLRFQPSEVLLYMIQSGKK